MELSNLIESENPDVLCIQETHLVQGSSQERAAEICLHEHGYLVEKLSPPAHYLHEKYVHNQAIKIQRSKLPQPVKQKMEELIPPKTPASEGILLAYKPGTLHSVQVLSIPNLELLAIKGILIDDTVVSIITFHAPNERGKREQFLEFVEEVVRTKKICSKEKTLNLSDTIILAGDYNTVPDTLLDRWLHVRERTESPKLREVLTITTDTYRKMHPEEYAYSWTKGSKKGTEYQKSRIDLQLLSKSSKMEILSSDIIADFETSSDHLPTVLVLKLQVTFEKTNQQRHTRWKCKIPSKEQETKVNERLKEKLSKEEKQVPPEQFSFLLHQTLLELGLIQEVSESERKAVRGKRVADMTKALEKLQRMLTNNMGKPTTKVMKLMYVASKWARQLDVNLPKPKAWTPTEIQAVQVALAELQDTLRDLDIDPQVHFESARHRGSKPIFDTCKYDGLKSPQPEFLRRQDKTFTKTRAEFF
jgi:exonuclease III